jgi:glycosyltransferase involved in cell wall biosynthesis
MTYKRPNYLRGAIETWLKQTHQNIELIISDDDPQSTESRAIAEEYIRKDKRIRYFRQEKNLNAPGCYKFILKQARGDYFIWASDDDLWDPRFLEDCLAVFRKRPECSLVFADMVDIDKDGREFKRIPPGQYLPSAEGFYDRLKQHLLFYMDDGKLQLIFGLWRRAAVVREPLFGPNERDDRYPYYWGFDNYLVLRSITNGPVGFVPEKRFFRRSRVLDEYRPPRAFFPRLAATIARRLEKVFASPYFLYVARHIAVAPNLSFEERAKLQLWNLFVMVRLFLSRKI